MIRAKGKRISAAASALLLVIASGCARDVKSGLDSVADSIAASQPITPDTVRSSAVNPRRLVMVQDTILKGSADTTSTEWLSSSQRMAFGSGFFVLFSARKLKVFDASGKHLWSTSPYEFAPGQVRNAKRSALNGRGADVEDWLDFTFSNDSPAPGALLSASSIEILGDSIIILQSNGQVNIYGRTGRSISLGELARSPDVLRGESSLSSSASGWLLLQRTFAATRSPATQRPLGNTSVDEFALNRVSLVNGEQGRLLRAMKVETPVVRARESAQGGRSITGWPLVLPTPIARISKGSTYWTTGADFSFDVYDEFGRLKRVIAVQADVVPITKSMIDSYAGDAARSFQTRADKGDAAALYWLREVFPKIRELPLPEHRPVVGSVWIGDDGSIAVRRADLTRIPADSSDSTVVDIVGADGRYRGRVAFGQPGSTISHFTGTAFYVAENAGSLALPVAARGGDSQGRDRAGNVVTIGNEVTTITYQRLVRYTIRDDGEKDQMIK